MVVGYYKLSAVVAMDMDELGSTGATVYVLRP
jgi:hypothetical protein